MNMLSSTSSIQSSSTIPVKSHSWSRQSKCAIVALAVASVGGTVFVILGSISFFGAVGSLEFIAAVGSGSGLFVVGTGATGWIVYSNQTDGAKVRDTSNEITTPSPKEETKPVEPQKPKENGSLDSDFAKEAFEFARAELKAHPELQPWKYVDVNKKPVPPPKNSEIALLTTLYMQIICPRLEDAHKKHFGNNPWQQKEVIEVADANAKISYVISSLILEESNFKEILLAEREMQVAFKFFSNFYHCVRGEGVPKQNRKENDPKPSQAVKKEYAEPFYQTDKIQYKWRILFNGFCDKVWLKIDRDTLAKISKDYPNWFIKDVGLTH
jgi:hypothetical protein